MRSLRDSGLTILLLVVANAASSDEREDRLSDEHRRWLKEEVVYIITDKEKDVLLSLEIEEQRDLFIDAFWGKRDPFPATLENEFKTEHYRRNEHANEHFSRDAPMPGWRTDRGKYYIILGEPASVQAYDGLSEVVSSEIWYYNGDTELGLPPRFNLLFFKDYGVGQHQLYSPTIHGPQRLLRAGTSLIPDPNQALDVLELVSIDLAIASVTVDLTEMGSNVLRAAQDPNSTFFRPSMTNNITMANIEESPTKRVDTDYLEGYLRFADRVSVEYSFNFVPNRFSATVLPGPDNTHFVHYILEIDPENFSVEGDNAGRFHTTLDIGVEVRDSQGSSFALANTVPLAISASHLKQVAELPFAYEDDFPIAVPGLYTMSVTWRNRFTKQFTVAEADIEVPSSEEEEISLSGVISAYSEEWMAGAKPDEYLTFQIGAVRMNPAVEGLFAIGDTVHAFTVVRGATPEYLVRFSLLNEEETLTEGESAVSANGLVGGKLSLREFMGGRYRLRAQLVEPSGSVVAESSETITVSPRAEILRAGLVYREGFHTEIPGLLALTRGEQLLVMGHIEEAIGEFQQSVNAANPRLPMAKWKLASALLYARQPDRALEILLPLKEQYPNQYEIVEGLGLAYYLKDEHPTAIPFLETAISMRVPDIAVLSALGTCYQTAGRVEDAKAMFKRSLELNPDQPAVQESLAKLGDSTP